jgi:hypothetical protein
MNPVTAIFTAVGQFLGWGRERQGLRNAPDVKAAEKAISEQARQDELKRAIAAKDDEGIRKAISE